MNLLYGRSRRARFHGLPTIFLVAVTLSVAPSIAQQTKTSSRPSSRPTLLELRRAAESRPAAENAGEARKTVRATINVGRYKITVDDTRWVGGSGKMFVDSGFPFDPQAFRPAPAMQQQGFFPPGFPAGAGFVVGPPMVAKALRDQMMMRAPAGFMAQAGAGFAPVPVPPRFGPASVDPDVVVDLRVTGPAGDRVPLVGVVVGKARATDDQGDAIEAPDLPAYLRLELLGAKYPRKSGCVPIHLQVDNKDAKRLKSLAGELLVCDAKVRTVNFQGRDLDKACTRKLDGAIVNLNEVQVTDEGVNVSVDVQFTPPRRTRGNSPAAARAVSERRAQLHVEIEDSEGQTVDARMVNFFTGSGGGEFTSFVTGPGGVRTTHNVNVSKSVSQWLQFPSLPEGVTLKRVVCTLTELVGQPQRLAFEFKDLPLP